MGNIRAGLESHLSTLVDVLATEYEGVNFTPMNDIPYQSCYVLRGHINDLGLGADCPTQDNGIFQVTLRFPTGSGSGGAETEALQVVEHFKRGTIINKNNKQIRINHTPTFKNLGVLDDRLLIAVSIIYNAVSIV